MAKRKNVIAPNDEKSLVAMEKMAVDVKKARELYGDGQPYEEERILDCIVFRAERASFEFEELGKYCLWYKAEAGHGKFLEGLERRNLDVRAAQWAMLMVEKFGSDASPVAHLGARKARCLTAFTKEEIAEYVNGGSLKGIPHDDVAKMTTRELEAEVRKLRKKTNDLKEQHKKELGEKLDEIKDLTMRVSGTAPLDKEQIAEKRLEELHYDFFGSLMSGIADIRRALGIIAKAEQTEDVTYPLIRAWMNRYAESTEGLTVAYNDLMEAIKQPCINNGEAEAGQ